MYSNKVWGKGGPLSTKHIYGEATLRLVLRDPPQRLKLYLTWPIVKAIIDTLEFFKHSSVCAFYGNCSISRKASPDQTTRLQKSNKHE